MDYNDEKYLTNVRIAITKVKPSNNKLLPDTKPYHPPHQRICPLGKTRTEDEGYSAYRNPERELFISILWLHFHAPLF